MALTRVLRGQEDILAEPDQSDGCIMWTVRELLQYAERQGLPEAWAGIEWWVQVCSGICICIWVSHNSVAAIMTANMALKENDQCHTMSTRSDDVL